MKPDSPCRECKNRTPGCHGACEAYNSWAKAQREAKRREIDAYYAHQYIPDNIKKYAWDRWKSATKRGKGKGVSK